jgi:hypothetical protein
MGDSRRCLIDVTSFEFSPAGPLTGPDLTPRSSLSEFEWAQVRQLVDAAADLASDVVLWHREETVTGFRTVPQRLAHGLGVAVLGALVMQMLSWVRLVEQEDATPETLRSARRIMETADPEVDTDALGRKARALLKRALDIKARARRVSRLWSPDI